MIGSRVAAEARSRGHEVTAATRSATAPTQPAPSSPSTAPSSRACGRPTSAGSSSVAPTASGPPPASTASPPDFQIAGLTSGSLSGGLWWRGGSVLRRSALTPLHAPQGPDPDAQSELFSHAPHQRGQFTLFSQVTSGV
ncbi:hypothetical protein [Streptomyces roseirectus]|uniref:hypothetical protein n=1 Tax=Streptomyces roseirectus TaxID=2768066 RepID=UPI001FEC51E7|nr:hypothetical protein [Streptomyces roseirectus]